MKSLALSFLLVATLLISQKAVAQAPPAKPVVSPQVNPDHSVTFRYGLQGATKVAVQIDWIGKPLPMQKGADGVWSVTTAPLPPEIYLYTFHVDGQSIFDPGNLQTIPNLNSRASVVEVPGDTPEPWDTAAVPHGEVHRHLYTSKVIHGLDQNQEPYLVYTPPGYDAHAAKPYPVLYLLHGWSQTEDGWDLNMHANLILDNLLAAGKMKPMVVVMPLGYGDMNFMSGWDVWSHPAEIDHNTNLFADALLNEILPQVEREYYVAHDRNGRAIAGLSMGGLESLSIGLAHTGTFAWIGGFSAAVHALAYPNPIPTLDAKAANLKLLWIACGQQDGLFSANQKLETYLRSQGLAVTAIETPGAHVAQVWRDNLIHFAPLLFTEK